MNTMAVNAVENYILELEKQKGTKKRVIQKWAAFEVLNRMLDRPFSSPIQILDDFIFEMEACRETSETVHGRAHFKIASYTGQEIERLFL